MPIIAANLPDLAGGQPEARGILRRLENGATLSGRIARPGPTGTTTVQIGSSLLQLVTPQSLAPGTLVTVRSQGGKILLEPQDPGSSGRPGTQGTTTPTGTPANPLAQGLATSPVLARVLQFHSLPLQLETLQILQSVLGNIPPEQGPVLAFLLARNVPITPENLAWIRERLRARGNLGRELGKLTAEIRNLLAQGGLRGSENLSNLLKQLEGMLTWDQSGSLPDRISHLRDFLTTLERKLLGGHPNLARNDFKSLLLELDHMLSLADLAETHPLRAAARKIIHLLEGAHLTGLSQTPTADSESWVFWRFPFPGDPTPTTVELAIRGERDPAHPERYDLKNLEILIQVDLSALGPVRIRVRSLEKNLSISFSVTEKKHHDYLIKELPILVETLGTVGFPQVQSDVRVEAIPEGSLADMLDPLKGWEKGMGQPAAPQLDIRL